MYVCVCVWGGLVRYVCMYEIAWSGMYVCVCVSEVTWSGMYVCVYRIYWIINPEGCVFHLRHFQARLVNEPRRLIQTMHTIKPGSSTAYAGSTLTNQHKV